MLVWQIVAWAVFGMATACIVALVASFSSCTQCESRQHIQEEAQLYTALVDK